MTHIAQLNIDPVVAAWIIARALGLTPEQTVVSFVVEDIALGEGGIAMTRVEVRTHDIGGLVDASHVIKSAINGIFKSDADADAPG